MKPSIRPPTAKYRNGSSACRHNHIAPTLRYDPRLQNAREPSTSAQHPSTAAEAADVVGKTDEQQDHEEADPHCRDALVDLAPDRAAAHSFDQREQDVTAVER